MTEAPHLLTHEQEGILIATFNRPTKLNAMSSELVALLEDAVLRLRDTPEIKVLLIRSQGRYFSSGADLKQEHSGPPLTLTTGSAIREMHRKLPMRRLWDEMERVEKPIVVAHHAMCVGGGLEMSLSCDFRLAAANAGYAFPEAQFGVLPATNGVSRLVRIVGPHWAKLLIMANIPATAQEALNMGLVHKVFPDETFQEDALDFCRHLTRQNGEMVGTAKIAIDLAADLDAHQAAAVERMANSVLMLMPDFQESSRRHFATVGAKKD